MLLEMIGHALLEVISVCIDQQPSYKRFFSENPPHSMPLEGKAEVTRLVRRFDAQYWMGKLMDSSGVKWAQIGFVTSSAIICGC